MYTNKCSYVLVLLLGTGKNFHLKESPMGVMQAILFFDQSEVPVYIDNMIQMLFISMPKCSFFCEIQN